MAYGAHASRLDKVIDAGLELQGIAALTALNILETEDVSHQSWDSAERIHAAAESIRLAYADALAYTADPEVPLPSPTHS